MLELYKAMLIWVLKIYEKTPIWDEGFLEWQWEKPNGPSDQWNIHLSGDNYDSKN